ncbi:MAG: hypothetical protein M3N91_10465 [Pseudomonadota bacterium]|nr:hypothetical protein [Pseudomonadota bacterium]
MPAGNVKEGNCVNKSSFAWVVSVALIGAAYADDGHSRGFEFKPNTLVLSRSVYVGTPSLLVPGVTLLPPGCVAGMVDVPLIAGGTTQVAVACSTPIADGTFPAVFNNGAADGHFGITSPIYLDNLSTDGHLLDTLAIPTDQIVTSFSSKSELAVNRSVDGRSITFMGYRGGPGFPTAVNVFDVSNANTPGVVDQTNAAVGQYFRSVAEVDSRGHLQITESNAYSGDNGRAAIKGDGLYYTVGNDNSGNLSKKQTTTTIIGEELVHSTGAELLVPGQAAPLPPNINKIGDFEINQVIEPSTGLPYALDKAGKDDNFRGLTIFNNTLYVTKGSGGNGINTVYQVGNAGVLPSGGTQALAALPITILPGLPNTLASGVSSTGAVTPVAFPFGIWFADEKTLYICDEGDGTLVTPAVNGNVADATTLATAGVQKWTLMNGTWHMDYVLQNGLNIGVPYSVPNYPAALNPATDGCRNIAGHVSRDGIVTIYAVTSTVSASGDQGADPNRLVKITDRLDATALPMPKHREGNEDHDPAGHFVTIRSAKAGEVFRGVALAPEDEHEDGHDE